MVLIKKITTVLIFFLINFSYSQKINEIQIDSLKHKLQFEGISDIEKIKVYNSLTITFFKKDIDSAFFYNRKLYQIAKKINQTYGLGLYFLNQSKGNLLSDQFFQAEKNSKKAQFLLLKIKKADDYVLSVYVNCFALDFQGKHIEAENLALKTIKKFANSKKIAEIYYFLSGLNLDYKKPKTAFLYVNKALLLFDKDDNKNGVFKCYFQMGLISYKTNDFNKYIYYIQKAAAINQKYLSDINNLISIYNGLSIYYLVKKEYSKAIKYSNLVIKIKKKDIRFLCAANNYLVNADAYSKLNKYDKAFAILNKVELDCKDDFDIFYFNQIKGDLYYETGKFDKALFFFKKNIKNVKDRISLYKNLADTEKKLGNYTLAYNYLIKYNQHSIDNLNKEKDNRVKELEVLFNLKSKDLELKEVLITKKKDEISFKNKLYYFNLSIIILILFVVISVISYVSYKTKLKHNILLENNNSRLNILNDEFQNSLIEKEFLLKEIHHRVKNNLQLIISLLNIQGSNDNSSSIADFLEKGQSRIQSISLIHQNLYESEHIGNINIQSYIESLGQLIFDIHQNKNKEVTMFINAKDIFFDMETAIPLGLIITELMSNSYKYAFVNKKTGVITINISNINELNFELTIHDNGIGFLEKSIFKKSVGLELVAALVLQLNGKLYRTNQNGTLYTISFQKII